MVTLEKKGQKNKFTVDTSQKITFAKKILSLLKQIKYFLRYKNYAVNSFWLSIQLPTFPSLSLTKSLVNINRKKVHVLVGDATVIHTL